MGIRDRLRRLEDRFRERGPSLEEVTAAFRRLAESARAKLRGESTDPARAAQDRDTVDRWEKARGADLQSEAQRAREKLRSVQRHL